MSHFWIHFHRNIQYNILLRMMTCYHFNGCLTENSCYLHIIGKQWPNPSTIFYRLPNDNIANDISLVVGSAQPHALETAIHFFRNEHHGAPNTDESYRLEPLGANEIHMSCRISPTHVAAILEAYKQLV